MAQEHEERNAATGARPGGSGGAPHASQALVERARRVLQHEQRTGHADAAVKPGGLESFIARWAEQARAARERGELSFPGARPPPPDEALAALFAGYAALDPMQRTAQVPAALALLDALTGSLSGSSSGPPPPAGEGQGGEVSR